jgi:hypothetical protein
VSLLTPAQVGRGSLQTREVRNTIAANILTGKTTTLISDPIIRLSLFCLMGWKAVRESRNSRPVPVFVT